jgi:hypothetical protein
MENEPNKPEGEKEEPREEERGKSHKSGMETGKSAEIEAADVIREMMPHHYKVSFGIGRAKNGRDAPDIIVSDGSRHQDHEEETVIAHGIMTRKSKNSGWSFTVVNPENVHHHVAHAAPHLNAEGIVASVRRRPSGTEKNEKSVNYGMGDVPLAVNWKPKNTRSIDAVVVHHQGHITEEGHRLAHAIGEHVQHHGSFVIDVKSKGSDQFSNLAFHVHRDKDHHLHFHWAESDVPHHIKHHIEHHMRHHHSHDFHKYLDEIESHGVGPDSRLVRRQSHFVPDNAPSIVAAKEKGLFVTKKPPKLSFKLEHESIKGFVKDMFGATAKYFKTSEHRKREKE